MIKTYYELAKPGIIYGNLVPTLGAFFFASKGEVNLLLCAATLVGLALVIASASVFNNYYDRNIDALMERTKGRALALGAISKSRALTFGAVLGIFGAGLLFAYASMTALVVACIGWFVYVALYTPAKHQTAYALFIGAVAGATPPVVGYSAVTNALDASALFLFLALFIWQLPHFIAIAYFRHSEYQAAGIPLFIKTPPGPAVKQVARRVFSYSLVVLLLFSLALTLLGFFG